MEKGADVVEDSWSLMWWLLVPRESLVISFVSWDMHKIGGCEPDLGAMTEAYLEFSRARKKEETRKAAR